MADQDDGDALRLGQPHQLAGAGAHLGHRAGPGLVGVGPQGLDGINDDDVKRLALQRSDDLAQGGGGGQVHRRGLQSHAFCAGANLLDRLLARDVGHLSPAQGRLGGDLKQQGGLAHAGIAAQQQGRTGHHAAAADPVELGHPGQDARRLGRVGLQRLELHAARPADRRRLQRAGRGRPALLDNGVPLTAGPALPGPFPVHSPAGLADIDRTVSRHGGCLQHGRARRQPPSEEVRPMLTQPCVA